MEIAEQRAHEEAERFLLPESLMERVRARECESEHDASARKRKRPTTGECRGLGSGFLLTRHVSLMFVQAMPLQRLHFRHELHVSNRR